MQFRIKRLLLLGLVIVALAAGARLVLGSKDAPAATDIATSTQPAEVVTRAVLIAPDAEQLPHKTDMLAVSLVEGVVPPSAVEAMVLTDEDCAPDAAGVSHCLNRLEVDGVEVAVRHSHRMHEVACLRPGESVRLVDGAAYDAM